MKQAEVKVTPLGVGSEIGVANYCEDVLININVVKRTTTINGLNSNPTFFFLLLTSLGSDLLVNSILY